MKKKTSNILNICIRLNIRFLMMVLLIFFTAGMQVNAQIDKKVTINVQSAPIRVVLDELQKSTQVHFMYEDDAISATKTVTLSYDNALLSTVLDDLCKQALLRYEVKKNIILIFPQSTQKQRQNPTTKITGKVTDQQGVELIGVSVMVVGATRGTATNIDGSYEIEVAPGETLLFSYVGMENKLLKVQPNERILDVVLMSSQTALEEIVITGYQTLSKERATGSYSVITEKDTKGKLETDIMSRIEGLVTGMNKMSKTDEEGNSYEQIIIRGIATYKGDQVPLYVVDGMPFEGLLSSINPSDVQNITVLKDATATSIYGARAANGVIVITTKRGRAGLPRISYTGSMKITPKPDLDYLNLTNSSELIDLQIEGFNFYHNDYDQINIRRSMNPVINILYQHEQGEISDLEKALLPYRNSNNRRQIEKEFGRVGISHQHNLSISGGSEKSQYLASINYTKEHSNQKYEYDERIGFNFKNNTELFKWLSTDLGVSGSFNKVNNKNSSYTLSSRRRGGEYIDLIYSYPSYYMLRDADGTPLQWLRGKSEYEIDRLKSIGLMDETYSPITDKSNELFRLNNNYYRIHAGFLIKPLEGLTIDLKYQTEGAYRKESILYSNQSWKVKNMINEAATYDYENDTYIFNVPKGGQLEELRKDRYSYTFRAQADYNRIFDKHDVSILGGAERRLLRETGTSVYYLGYSDNGLIYTPYDPILLSSISGTESINGFFGWSSSTYNYRQHAEDRYVSFYSNASYTYDSKYSVTGSFRIDQSDLYGTDPKHRYRPFWSVGGSWHIKEESFMQAQDWINSLKVRTTYGIGGNIPKNVRPHLNTRDTGYNTWVGAKGSTITNPPNPNLKWEKTATTNIGLDFSLFNYRLNGSFNYYNRKSSDLLGGINTDPTLGWKNVTLNYGDMTNNGVEIDLHGIIIQNDKFNWETNLNFSYNKNKLTNLEGTKEGVFNYTAYNVAAVGYPLNSLFSYRYAGLDPKDGGVLVYNKEGEKVREVDSVDDLVYSGTRVPKYTASFKNTFSYKNFDLSFMFIYYGGHVLRDVIAGYMTGAPSANVDRKTLNHWRKPGDENIPGVAPALIDYIDYTTAQAWYSADVHVKKADYIKLRDISLSYNVPRKWLEKYKLRSLTLTCQVSDPWWWAKNGDIDPEAYVDTGYGIGAYTLPNPTTCTFGLSVEF